MPSANPTFDAVIAGAGPAGGTLACLLARRGLRVLLAERSRWPRAKVCGGCLSAEAVGALHGVQPGVARLGRACGEAVFHTRGRRVRLPTPGMRVIARAELDAAIVTAAIDAGAEFRPECRAELLSAGSALLVTEDGEERVACGVFVSAEGLAGSSLARVGGFGWRVARTGLVGLGGTAPSCAPGQALDMYVGPGGYVGCVALASGERVVAAAVSPAAIREHGGPWPTCEAIIRGAGGPGEMLARLSVRGVPVLSRRRERVEGPGVLVLGDAAGYVEPITGEGMAWAVLGALEAEAHAVRMAMGGYAAGQWSRALGRLFGWRRARCRVLAGALRWGPTAALLGMVASWRPELCGPREGPPRRLAGA